MANSLFFCSHFRLLGIIQNTKTKTIPSNSLWNYPWFVWSLCHYFFTRQNSVNCNLYSVSASSDLSSCKMVEKMESKAIMKNND